MDAYQEAVGSCYRYEKRVCTKEEEGVSIIKEGKRRGA